MRIGIVAALASEAAVFGALRGPLLADHEYELVVSGPGHANAAQAASELIQGGSEALLSWGLAGGLDHELAAGDIVVANGLRGTDGVHLAADASLLAMLRTRLDPVRTRTGTVLSVDSPVAGCREKVALNVRYGACAVEMEALAVARTAHAAGLPFLCLRVICDPVDCEIPAAALAGMAADGTLQPWRTLTALIAAPRQLPGMLQLALHYRRALASLREAAQRLA